MRTKVRSEIAKKSLDIIVAQVAIRVAQVAVNVVLARVLGPHDRGIYAYIVSVLSVCGELAGGPCAAASWAYGKLKTSAHVVYRSSLKTCTLIALPVCIALAIIARQVPGQLPLVVAAVATPCILYSEMVVGFFLADSKVRLYYMLSAFPIVGLYVVGLPILLVAHLGLEATFIALAVSYVAASVYSGLQFHSNKYRAGSAIGPSLRSMLDFSLRVAATNLVRLLNFRIDVFLVFFMLGAKELGIYGIAVGLGEVVLRVSNPLSFAAYGRITSAAENEAAALVAKCTRHSIAVVLILSLFIYLLATPLVTFVYGKPYTEAGAVVRVLLPGIIAYSTMPALTSFFVQQLGRPNVPLFVNGVSTVICAFITILSIRSFGITGAAFATSVSYILSFMVIAVWFLRHTGLPLNDVVVMRRAEVRRAIDFAVDVLSRTAPIKH